MQKITPFLWFNGNVEEAINFYTSVFRKTSIGMMQRMGPDSKVFTATFEIEGQQLMALDGGPKYEFTPAISLFVNCDTEDYTNALWERLSEGGKVLMPLMKYPFSEKFGWVQDQFGLSWQLNLTGSAPKVSPCLMFANEQKGRAEEAINFYSSLFKPSETILIARYEAGEVGVQRTIKHAAFSLAGQEFKSMDSHMENPFKFTPAFSFFINCEGQAEVDDLWARLSDGGGESRCGWVWDKFGVSWQVIPSDLMRLMYGKDRERSQRVMQAMLKMDKIIIADLEKAYNGE